jgi:hypothetical protein
MCDDNKPCDSPCEVRPTDAQLAQLRAMVREREASIVHDKLVREKRELHEKAKRLTALREAIAEVLHGQGVGWLWVHGGDLVDAGRWERCVELSSVTFEVPGFRAVRLYMGLTEGRWEKGAVRGTIFYQWQPASFQTGDEVPTWCGTDVRGREVAANCFREALALSMVQPEDADVILF